MCIKSLKMVFVARIIRHRLCMIYAFFWLSLLKNYLKVLIQQRYFIFSSVVKVTGDMTVSFPANIVSILSNQAQPPVLSFIVTGTSSLEQIYPNKALVEWWVIMKDLEVRILYLLYFRAILIQLIFSRQNVYRNLITCMKFQFKN